MEATVYNETVRGTRINIRACMKTGQELIMDENAHKWPMYERVVSMVMGFVSQMI